MSVPNDSGGVATVCLTAQEAYLGIYLCDIRYPGTVDHDPLPLLRTLTAFGVTRVQFLCPRCSRSCGKLYLPPGEARFLCRTCHNLTYKSQQTRSRKQVKETPERQRERREWRAELLEEWARRQRLEETEARRSLAREGFGFDDDELGKSANDLASLRRPRGRPKEKRPYVRTFPFLTTARGSPQESLCMKCRDWREPMNPQPIILANRRAALRGTCPVCKSTMVTIIKAGS